jgi:DNA-binding NarL/FixJ family response regulator
VTVHPPITRSIRVLLVDDRTEIREALSELLQDQGITIAGLASDGPQAVDAARDLRPDVVLMDLHLPTMSGLEATRRMRATDPRIPVVLLTAYDDPSMKRDASAAGALAYLVKGCSAASIVGTLERVARSPGPTA